MAAPKMLCWQEQHALFEWEVPQRSSFTLEFTTDKNKRQEAISKIVCLLKELTGSKLVIRTPLDVKVKRCGCKQPLGVCHRIFTVGKHLTIETQTFPHCYTDFRGLGGGRPLQTVPCFNHAASLPLRTLEVMQIFVTHSFCSFCIPGKQ